MVRLFLPDFFGLNIGSTNNEEQKGTPIIDLLNGL